MRVLEDHVPPLRAPTWAGGGHRQTLLGVWLPDDAPEVRRGARHDVTLEDGDRLVTFEVTPPAEAGPADREPVVVHLFHGLTGSVDSGYVRRATERFTALGHTVVAVNHRGAGDGEGLARGLYHSGVSADISAAIAAGRARHPGARHLAIGYSLSGNALLLLLGRDRHLPQPDAAIAVNPPVDLFDCVERIGRRRNRLYELNFVRGCRAAVEARVEAGLLPETLLEARASTLREFDERVTSEVAGFAGADDYYGRSSARPWLAEIAAPTLVVTSRDDPLIGWDRIAEASRSPSLDLHLEDVGGHMGYLTRSGALGFGRWLEDALVAAARRVLPGSSFVSRAGS